MEVEHDAYAALRYPDYRWFLLSRIAASFASRMEAIALGWQVYERTRSPLALGFIGLAEAFPALGLALFAGHVADRRDRRSILLITRAALTLCSAGLLIITLADTRPVLPIYAVLFVVGIASGFQGPAGSALMPQLMPPEAFPNAITWQTTLFHLSSLIGPLLGGLLLNWHRNPAHVYTADVLFGAIATVALAFVRPRPVPQHEEEETVLQSLASGIRYVWSRQVILAAITLDLFAVLFGGAVALLPVFARDILHVGPLGLGALGAATPAGATVMALLLVHRPPIRRAGRALLVCVALFGAAMIGFGLSRSFALSLLCLAFSGAADNVSMVVRSVIVQGTTPNAMRGRVSAVNSIFVGASNEIGGFESGVTARLFGTVPSVVLGGIMTLVVVLVSAWRWPDLRRLGSLSALSVGAQEDAHEPDENGVRR